MVLKENAESGVGLMTDQHSSNPYILDAKLLQKNSDTALPKIDEKNRREEEQRYLHE